MKTALLQSNVLFLMAFVAMMLTGCVATPPINDDPPHLADFEVTPLEVCTNTGQPLVRLSWQVTGQGASEVEFRANDLRRFTGQVFDEQGHPAAFAGRNSYSRSLSVNLRDFFDTIPQTIRIQAILREHHDVGTSPPSTVRERQTKQITTRVNCP